MPMVRVFTTLMLSEALVVESLLNAHDIATEQTGRDIVSQCPQLAIMFSGVSIFVDEDDAAAARELIRSGEEVPGYKSVQSRGFERRPLFNAILAFLMLIMGAPFPFWYRNTAR